MIGDFSHVNPCSKPCVSFARVHKVSDGGGATLRGVISGNIRRKARDVHDGRGLVGNKAGEGAGRISANRSILAAHERSGLGRKASDRNLPRLGHCRHVDGSRDRLAYSRMAGGFEESKVSRTGGEVSRLTHAHGLGALNFRFVISSIWIWRSSGMPSRFHRETAALPTPKIFARPVAFVAKCFMTFSSSIWAV